MKNTKTLLLWTAVLVAALALFAWAGMPDLQKEESAKQTEGLEGASLLSDETAYDFGTVSMAAGKVAHTFKINNLSALPVTIEKIYTSCMCTVASLVADGESFGPYGMPGHGFIPKINKAINAGAEAAVDVVFDPAAHGPAGVGRIERNIIVEYDGGQSLEFSFVALVTP